MFTRMTLAGIERDVNPNQVEHYKTYGWKILGADPVVVAEETPATVTVDSGEIKTRAPKKKKMETSTENARDAVEDLGNANEGE